jgi:DNA primase
VRPGAAVSHSLLAAARLLSVLIYGTGQLGDPTAASAYAVASQNPLLVIDNLEHDDFTKSILKFLLLSATKGGKEKRTQGTDSDTIQEQPKALVLITAIEPFVKAELINRTFDIDFSFRYKSDAFVEDDVVGSVIKKRDLIISTILKFLNKEVLPHLEARKDFITILKRDHKNHAKNRTDEYLALLLLMLEKLLPFIQYYGPEDFLYGTQEEYSEAAKEIRTAWIDYQNRKAKDTETSSNSIIKLLDGLVREYMAKMREMEAAPNSNYRVCVSCGEIASTAKAKACEKCEGHLDNENVFVYTHPDYHIELVKTVARMHCVKCHGLVDAYAEHGKCVCEDEQSGEIYSRAALEFTATSNEIVGALDRYCRNNGLKNPYETASIFTKRVGNDLKVLKTSGWEVVTNPKLEQDGPYFKKVQGVRFMKFRKAIVR